METEDHKALRRRWVAASIEGRFATADYLAAHLPPVKHKGVPEGERQSFTLSGEIHEQAEV